jgi:hypothetical protein
VCWPLGMWATLQEFVPFLPHSPWGSWSDGQVCSQVCWQYCSAHLHSATCCTSGTQSCASFSQTHPCWVGCCYCCLLGYPCVLYSEVQVQPLWPWFLAVTSVC